MTAWIGALRGGESPVQTWERLDPDLQGREAVMLGLRQIAGIDRGAYREQFGREVRDLAPCAYDQFVESRLLEETKTHLRLTLAGRFLADTVMAEFYEKLDASDVGLGRSTVRALDGEFPDSGEALSAPNSPRNPRSRFSQ